MSPAASTKTKTDSSIIVTNRTAIDISGRVGSLYDGYRDCILGHLNVKDEEKLYSSYKVVQCDIKHGNNNQTHNIFRLLSIDEQLRLSILLELAPKKGIASVIDYPYATKECTRIFWYSYVDRIQQLPGNVEDARAYIKSLTSGAKATHIITDVHWGIDFVVVLELPIDTKATEEIDHVLHEIRTFLLNGDKVFTLTLKEQKWLESIVYTKIYSNIPDLYRVNTLYDVCRYIEQNKYSNVYHPVSYTLRPIKWLHPHYTEQNITFISLPGNLNDNIEQYVFQLREDIKKLERTIYVDLPKLLCGHLKERLSNLQKQWLTIVKKNYTNEIERLSELIIDVRKDRVLIPMIDQAVKKNEQSIRNGVDDLTQYLNDLKEKGKLITSLMEQKFEYVNVADYGIDQIDDKITIERKLVLDEQRDCLLCSNDTLNEIKAEQLKNLRRNMIKEFNNNSNLRLIYADFSYCSFELQDLMRLPSNKYNGEQKKPKKKEATSFRELQTISSPSINAQTARSLPAETRTYAAAPTKVHITDTLSTKIQTNDLLSTKSQMFLSPVKEKQTSVPARATLDTTGPFFANI